jgi:hypothetical protein
MIGAKIAGGPVLPKKVVAALTAVVFVLFSTSCVTWRTKEVRTYADMPYPHARVMRVVKKSGEVIEFSRYAPARIVGNQVVGTTRIAREREVEIEGPFPLIRRLDDGTPAKVTDAKGRVWSVRKVLKEEPNRMTILAAEQVTGSLAIPLSEVRWISIRRPNVPLTILAVLGALGVASYAFVVYNVSRY